MVRIIFLNLIVSHPWLKPFIGSSKENLVLGMLPRYMLDDLTWLISATHILLSLPGPCRSCACYFQPPVWEACPPPSLPGIYSSLILSSGLLSPISSKKPSQILLYLFRLLLIPLSAASISALCIYLFPTLSTWLLSFCICRFCSMSVLFSMIPSA